ncbi:MAG TPA: hypothetical protein DCS07_14780 [Bdellovibrionales bacterium]|nr:hypothetical protein [Bdellovibrionales bacterium]HCM40158.1 hypothetical protein [Bdellovibrionales bacterium]
MDPDPGSFASLEFGIILTCLILSAAFSASETAITSFSELKAKHLVERLGVRAKAMRFWLRSPTRVLTTILVGNNLVNIGGSVIATDLILRVFPSGGVLIATATMTISILIFSEIIPKVVARSYSDQLVLPAIHFVRFVHVILYPLIYLLSKFAEFTLRLLRADSDRLKPSITEEELTFLIGVGEKEGALEKEQHRLLSNVFQFGSTVVREIMIPRTDIVGVPRTAEATIAVQLMLDKGHSRLPVFDQGIDQIVGIIHAKELLRRTKEHGNLNFPVSEVLREPWFVAEGKPVAELLPEMKTRKRQMAIVLDEHGGTAGLITFEDLIEEIVGEIRDEYDEQEEDMLQVMDEPGTFLVDARMNFTDFATEFGTFFPVSDPDHEEGQDGSGTQRPEAPSFDTLGGMIIDHLGHIPKPGEQLRYGELLLTVKVADRYRLRKILLKVLALESAEQLSESRDPALQEKTASGV